MIDIICGTEPHQTLISGQGILELYDHCSIQLPQLQIQSVYQIKTRINRSYLPKLNLIEQIRSKNETLNKAWHRLNETGNDYHAEINLLQKQMKQIAQQVKGAESNLTPKVHTGMNIGMKIIIMGSLAIALTLRLRNKSKKPNETEKNENLAQRSPSPIYNSV